MCLTAVISRGVVADHGVLHLVESAARKNFVVEAEARRFDYLSCSSDKNPPRVVGRNLEYDSECDRFVPRVGVLFEDFSALNKSQVGVELLLKNRLMPCTVGPVQVIGDRENDMAGLAVSTHDVNHSSFFDGHRTFYPGTDA
jgi:hypothetical protein